MSTPASEPTETPEQTALTYTRKQACARLNISLSLLDELIESKQLGAVRLGRRVLVPESELQRLIAAHRIAVP